MGFPRGRSDQVMPCSWPARFAHGRGDRIRTDDLLNPIQVRYRTALRPDRSLV